VRQPGFEHGACRVRIRSVQQLVRSVNREGLSLTLALVPAEGSYNLVFLSMQVLPSEQLSMRLTAAVRVCAVEIHHEVTMNE
jgi:hypothetical protein